MSPTPATVLALTVAFALILVAGSLKLAAFLYRRTVLPWRRAWGLAGMGLLLSIGAQFLAKAVGASGGTAAVGSIAYFALGAWYLGTWARAADGTALRARDRVLLMSIHSVLLLGLFVGLNGILRVALQR